MVDAADALAGALIDPAAPGALECDVAVVGSGAGGSTVALELAAAGLSVMILEEGPYIPAQLVPDRATESFRAMWRNGGLTTALGKPPVSYAEGRCVGGSTEINSAIFQRLPEDLAAEWARTYAIAEFSDSALASHFDAVSQAVNASPTAPPLGRASDILREGGEKLGWRVTALERAQKGCVGTNLCSFGCPTGGKQSMTRSLLPRAAAAGLRVLPGCRVVGIERSGARATGLRVRLEDGGRTVTRRVTAGRAVYLCAGAIGTPALLRRTGLAGANIGRTLRLHPSLRVLASFRDPVDAFDHRLPLYAVSEFMPDQRIGGSVMTPATFGMALAEDWAVRRPLLSMPKACAGYYAMARAEGMGTVTPLPGFRDPLVRYRLTRRDWRNLTEGLARLARVLFAAGADRLYPGIAGHAGWTTPGTALAEMGDLLAPAQTSLMTIHMFASCRMGESAQCDVDSFGRVKGLENLFVADASIIPEATGVNPQATVMALARRTAQAHLAAGDQARRRAALGE